MHCAALLQKPINCAQYNLILHQVQPHLLSVAHFCSVRKGNRVFSGAIRHLLSNNDE